MPKHEQYGRPISSFVYNPQSIINYQEGYKHRVHNKTAINSTCALERSVVKYGDELERAEVFRQLSRSLESNNNDTQAAMCNPKGHKIASGKYHAYWDVLEDDSRGHTTFWK